MKKAFKKILVFDLDDTLFKEIEFVKSAYTEIARIIELQIGKNIFKELMNLFKNKKPVFDLIVEKYKLKLSIKDLVDIYRYHSPSINLIPEILEFINSKKYKYGFALVTDGRSVTQRNKIKALKIEKIFKDNIYISEEIGFNKLSTNSFNSIINNFPNANFIYFADNVSKDFLIPNQLGWLTIQIKDIKKNIHPCNIFVRDEYKPKKIISYKSLNKINF